ncbi:alpha/beta fold hydrolase [Haloterrigena alkaliphila]|uniref:Alpha/beta hydrolase n=1 Tax=Haloterrigena alkaliphila TaxID=2816475 RepID=A0A8A2VH03_9EURY|nr:alpha/beta fold hydrolase [Haloterrigena alkaliphila]QSW99685.1 alpha/beta hydrolase [Haloterrigena alkaliphila]
MTDTNRQQRQNSAADRTVTTRRTLLKATGTTLVGGAGLAATSGSASAQWGGPDVIEIDDGGWFGGWSADGSLPVTDELLIFIHGWFGDTTASSQASDVESSLESGGYSPDETVAIEWPGTTLNFAGAEADTEDVGDVVAGLVEEFYDNGGGNIRLVGHSLGGRCVYWTATKLSSGYEIETVAGLGAAADGSEICGDPWNPGLGNACEVRNYHSNNDSTVGGAYGGFGDTALGTEGAGCDPGSNYTDVDVTGSVGGHLEYLGDGAVGSDLADAINSGSCDSSGGGDDGSDGDDGWGWF